MAPTPPLGQHITADGTAEEIGNYRISAWSNSAGDCWFFHHGHTGRSLRQVAGRTPTPSPTWPAHPPPRPSVPAGGGRGARDRGHGPPLPGQCAAVASPPRCEGRRHMPVDPPTVGQLASIAESFGLALSDEDLASFRGLIL